MNILNNETPLECAKYIICYRNSALSQILTLCALFFATLLLIIGTAIVNKKVKEKIEKNKKIKKKFIDECSTWLK